MIVRSNMNIVLTGLRGSGKTKVGKLISKKLGWDFIDIDEKIEKKERMKISNIVEKKGWDYFRQKESEMVRKLGELDQTVIATGGGTIVDKENEKELKKNGKIIYLYVRPDVCAERIADDDNRPALTDLETALDEMNELYKQRNERYCKSATKIYHRTEDPDIDASGIINYLFAE